jgi:hypothetical protein
MIILEMYLSTVNFVEIFGSSIELIKIITVI